MKVLVILMLAISLIIVPNSGINASTDDVLLLTGEWEPFTSENLEGYGFISAIVDAVFKEMGRDHQLRFYPWARGEAITRSGNAWGTFPYAPSNEREKDFHFSDPIYTTRSPLFYLKDQHDGFEFGSLSELQDYRVAGLQAYVTLEILTQAGVNTVNASTAEAAFNMLLSGRVDFVPENTIAGWNLVEQMFPDKVDEIATTKTAVHEGPLVILVSKSYPGAEDLLDDFNNALARIKDNGVYEQILNEYNIH